jgi:Matrixin/PEP-CTERM motif
VSNLFFHLIRKCRLVLSVLMVWVFIVPANAYVISDLSGTPTEGWDGAGIGAATINYYLGYSAAPGNGFTNGGGLTPAQIETELTNAMATWSSVADVTFNRIGDAVTDTSPGATPAQVARAAAPWTSPGDEILMYFHGSGWDSDGMFDGAGLTTVFAHAWGPADISGFTGNIHMDSAENWLTGLGSGTAYTSVAGIDLETIFTHEVGHSLGLGHDPLGGFGPTVMAEFSNRERSVLTSDDIAGIRQLYSWQGQDWSNGDPGVDPGDDDGPPDQDPRPVPEPGTLFLLGTGLLILAGFRRRKESAAL